MHCALAWALLFLFFPECRADTTPQPAEVLAKIRQATGYERFKALPHGLLLHGTVKYLGLDGELALLCDAHGRFHRQIKHRLGEEQGFDGKVCWINEQGQTSRILELEDRDTSLAVNWIQSGHWLAEPSPFELTVAADKTNEKTLVMRLRLKQEPFKAELTIDRLSWLPTKLERTTAVGKMVWSFDDYREVLGIKLPHRITLVRAGLSNTTTILKVREASKTDRNPYAFVPVAPKDVSFDPSVSADLKVERTRTGHFLVQARINGEEPGWFIFDSGAGAMVIDKQLADKLGLESFGEMPVVGIGGVMPSKFRQAKSFQLGPLTLSNPEFIEINMQPFSLAMGRKIVGICGAPLFKRAIIEVEVTTPRLAFHDPAKYKLEGGQWGALALRGNLPCVKARLEGDREGLFRLDTGATGTVTFHAPTVQEWKLLDGRQTRTSMAGGVGGFAAERVGQLEWFELGSHRFETPQVAFSLAKSGAFLDEYLAGNIGSHFLVPFRIVFDYPQKRIAFIKIDAGGK